MENRLILGLLQTAKAGGGDGGATEDEGELATHTLTCELKLRFDTTNANGVNLYVTGGLIAKVNVKGVKVISDEINISDFKK